MFIFQSIDVGKVLETVTSLLKEGVVESANSQGEFYMPHRAVIRETAQSTKMCILYDCSALEEALTLNGCLEPGLLLNKV